MKVLKKVFFLLILLIIYCISLNLTHSKQLLIKRTCVFHSKHNSGDTSFLYCDSSPFHVTLPERISSINQIINQRVLKNNFNSFLVFSRFNKRVTFIITSTYQSFSKFIYCKLKISNLLYPFHYFW